MVNQPGLAIKKMKTQTGDVLKQSATTSTPAPVEEKKPFTNIDPLPSNDNKDSQK